MSVLATGGGSNGVGSSAFVSLTLPPAARPGHLLVILTAHNNIGTTVDETGWVKASGPQTVSAGLRAYVLWRMLDAATVSAGSITLQWGASGRPVALGVVVDDVDPATPVETSPPFASIAGASLAAPTGPPAVVAGSETLLMAAARIASGPGPDIVPSAPWLAVRQVATTVGTGANVSGEVARLPRPGPAGAVAGGGAAVTTDPAAAALIAFAVTLRRSPGPGSAGPGLAPLQSLGDGGAPTPRISPGPTSG